MGPVVEGQGQGSGECVHRGSCWKPLHLLREERGRLVNPQQCGSSPGTGAGVLWDCRGSQERGECGGRAQTT